MIAPGRRVDYAKGLLLTGLHEQWMEMSLAWGRHLLARPRDYVDTSGRFTAASAD